MAAAGLDLRRERRLAASASGPRRVAVYCARALLTAMALGLAGCQTDEAGKGNPAVPLQSIVESKSAAQRQEADGFQRWDDFKSDEYQRSKDIQKDRGAILHERDRQTIAESVSQMGAVPLETCLAYSLEFNDRIQAARAAIKAVGGDALITRSRFLPHLTYDLELEDMTKPGIAATNETLHAFHFSETIFEFGKDNPVNVTLRDEQRQSLFTYEDTVRDVLSESRKRFFTILLRERQLAERRKTLHAFEARYEQITHLEESGRVAESDVLTARLNMLNEEARINGLEREIVRKKTELLHFIGFPLGLADFTMKGEIEEFSLSVEDCVSLALRRSSTIAQYRAAVDEQMRRLREVRWDYAPSLALQSGWKDSQTAGGLQVETTQGTYSVSTFADRYDGNLGGPFGQNIALPADDGQGWFVQMSVDMPIFQGLEREGRYKREKALLEQARHSLRDKIDGLEQDVRTATQTVLEHRKEVEILRETVTISTERLRVQERLKELGKISDNDLENFRQQFFNDQDSLFVEQIALVEAQEDLRLVMRYFEPVSAKE